MTHRKAVGTDGAARSGVCDMVALFAPSSLPGPAPRASPRR